MTVRNLALQLYRWMKRVEELKKEMAEAPWEERRRLEEELRQARQQVERYHKLLEAQKEKVEI